jgi:DNA repair protein RecN (Recombination protein N)
MLQKLHIQNYAIIDEIDIDFSAKLNIITGETGAGKSILMGALNLILGERADTNVLRKQDKKCCIEGYFDVAHKTLVQQFLHQHELDNDGLLVVRREIATSGKSRSFINDTPVTLQQLKALASLLVDLHQQFDTLEIGEARFQREVIDALAQNETVLTEYLHSYKQWITAKHTLQQLTQQKADFAKELDYHQFLYNELADLHLQPNELEDAENEIKLLSNSEGIKTALAKVYYDIKESDMPVTVLLKQLSQQLQHFATLHPEIPSLVQRLQSAQIELQDIAYEAERMSDDIQYDAKRIDLLNEKLALGYKLLKKHGVNTTAELLALQAQLEEKLQAVLHIDDTIAAQTQLVNSHQATAVGLAKQLSALRSKQAAPLEKQVNALLAKVGMPNARLQVSITAAELNEWGADHIELLFDANKSNRFEPIRKVASGGELSRLMLCIKSLVAAYIDMPTLIFDEIDTGISGEAAKQVGSIMKQLATNRQIICITHQPQMAGKADAHYFVYKTDKNNTVQTNIKLLQPAERIRAIAQMLGGEQPSAAALANAKEMLEH